MENLKEEWRDIEGYEGLYQVSNFGRVKSLERWLNREDGYCNHIMEKILKPTIINSGYYAIGLHLNKSCKKHLIHRLVAYAFILNPNNYQYVNHKDENKQNNCVENLEWCTAEYNVNYNDLNVRSGLKRRNGKLAKKVLQFDNEGNFIKEWPSGIEIQRQTGMCSSWISDVCLGKHKQAYGYVWKFKETA